jgi:L-asparaginase II
MPLHGAGEANAGSDREEGGSELHEGDLGGAASNVFPRSAIFAFRNVSSVGSGDADEHEPDRLTVDIASRSGVAGDADAERRSGSCPNSICHLLRDLR